MENEKDGSNLPIIAIASLALLLIIAMAGNWFLIRKMRRSRQIVQPSPTLISLSDPETENLTSSTEPLNPISSDIGPIQEQTDEPLPSMVPDVEWSSEPHIDDIQEENSMPR